MAQRKAQPPRKRTPKRLVPITHRDSKVHVALPTTGTCGTDDLAEAKGYLETLEKHGQLQETPGPLRAGATHQIETDGEGRKVLKRKRFSAI